MAFDDAFLERMLVMYYAMCFAPSSLKILRKKTAGATPALISGAHRFEAEVFMENCEAIDGRIWGCSGQPSSVCRSDSMPPDSLNKPG